jgi:hypothetical protein
MIRLFLFCLVGKTYGLMLEVEVSAQARRRPRKFKRGKQTRNRGAVARS